MKEKPLREKNEQTLEGLKSFTVAVFVKHIDLFGVTVKHSLSKCDTKREDAAASETDRTGL